MVLIYALISAFTFGTADYLGGLSTRKNSSLTVVAWSQGMGLLTALIVAPLLGASALSVTDILWGMAAGLSGAVGVSLLYRGLASGLASIVSPMAALTGAAIPVLFGLLIGERPTLLTWIGIALALPAILLLSLEGGEKNPWKWKSFQLGFFAGTSFGFFFILIARSADTAGMWPLLAARCTTVPIFFLVILSARKPLKPVQGTWLTVIFSGILDMMANMFYLLAARTGYLILAVILTALYPAPTVFLQSLFFKEKLNPARIIGMILAIAGAALIGIGG